MEYIDEIEKGILYCFDLILFYIIFDITFGSFFLLLYMKNKLENVNLNRWRWPNSLFTVIIAISFNIFVGTD